MWSSRLRVRRNTAPSVLLVVTLATIACSGGGDSGPAGPGGGSVSSVSVAVPSTSLVVGEMLPAEALAKDADGKTVQATFTWSSDNEDVLTVNSQGQATGVTAGTAVISATASGKTGTVSVTVAPMDLSTMVEGVRSQRGLPAMSAAIVTRQGLVAIGVAGTRQAGGVGGAVTLADKWHIGSNLKAITAALAAVAVTEGKISWTTTVEDAFPEHAASMHSQYRTVKLEDLLANRAGIRNNPPASAYSGSTARQQRESLVAWALGATPVNAVGTYFYSNPSFVIAGAMVERALGGDYEALVQSKLGQPLGVTSLGWGTVPAGNPVAHYRSGANWIACTDPSTCDNPPGLSAAGRAHMSMGDWSKIIGELLRADAGASTLISAADGRKLFTGVTPIAGSDTYGLGWIMTSRPWASGRTATHSGSNNLNFSVAWLGMGPGVGFLVTTNASDANTPAAVDQLILEMLNSYF